MNKVIAAGGEDRLNIASKCCLAVSICAILHAHERGPELSGRVVVQIQRDYEQFVLSSGQDHIWFTPELSGYLGVYEGQYLLESPCLLPALSPDIMRESPDYHFFILKLSFPPNDLLSSDGLPESGEQHAILIYNMNNLAWMVIDSAISSTECAGKHHDEQWEIIKRQGALHLDDTGLSNYLVKTYPADTQATIKGLTLAT